MISLVKYGHPALRMNSRPIKRSHLMLEEIANRMIDIMRAYHGIGLAAPQVGIPWQLFVMEYEPKPLIFVNSVVTPTEKATKVLGEEGCLSLPGIVLEVERHSEVIVEYLDLQRNRVKMKASGMIAACIQHELDHLQGKLIIDYHKVEVARTLTTYAELNAMQDWLDHDCVY